MKLVQTLSLIGEINKKLDSFKAWLMKDNNEYFFVALFFAGLIVFLLVYDELHKD
jgi:hypothetical protein